MKTIQIKSLSLLNFKGIRKLTIDFSQETSIHGANRAGKTTVADAISFLLFGKNSTGETNFNIKTLDKNNNVIPKIDHEVEGVLIVNGEEMTLKKTYREKWVKKRGALEMEFAGNETEHHWNDVPMTLRDYTTKINDIVEENIFKLITSPAAFISLKWNEQRQVLIDIAGGVTDQDIAAGNPEFEGLLSKLTNKTMEEYQKQIASSIRKSKDEIKMIPSRVDEVERGKPEAIDFAEVRRDLAANEKELAAVDNQISDKVAAQQEVLNKRQAIQKEIHTLQSQIEDEKHTLKLQAKTEYQKQSSVISEIQAKIDEANENLSKAQRTLGGLQTARTNERNGVEDYTKRNVKIRQQWTDRNAETFQKKEFQMDEDSCKCPTCKREFEAEDIEAKKKEMFANFQEEQKKKFADFQNEKMKDLEEISAKGKSNAKIIEVSQQEIARLDARIEKGEGIIENIIEELTELNQALETAKDNSDVKSEEEIYNQLFSKNKDIKAKVNEVAKLNDTLKNEKGIDIEDLKNKKAQYTEEISKIKSRLLLEDQIKNANTRIESLQKEESTLSQTIADYERDQYTIEQFVKAKMDKLESKINERFSFVKFKLFEVQVNGSEIPTCKAMVNGVPIQDVNTEGRVNAGIDVINVLSEYYGVSAPITCDNRESVTDLIETPSQIINLIVSPKDKKLRVEANNLVKELF